MPCRDYEDPAEDMRQMREQNNKLARMLCEVMRRIEDCDVVVTKRRGSAFSGSDLDLVLRARDIDSLVLTGIATSAVVLSTLWHAIDLDFGLTVLADACLDTDPEVHTMLTEKLFPQWADVLPVEGWLKAIAPQ